VGGDGGKFDQRILAGGEVICFSSIGQLLPARN
jgi:hypothetical protein